MKVDKLNRLLPSASMRFIDNGFIVTMVDPSTGHIFSEELFEDFTAGLKAYKKFTEMYGEKIEAQQNKDKPKVEEETDELE